MASRRASLTAVAVAALVTAVVAVLVTHVQHPSAPTSVGATSSVLGTKERAPQSDQ
jgi:negative regulator of sigma E activity